MKLNVHLCPSGQERLANLLDLICHAAGNYLRLSPGEIRTHALVATGRNQKQLATRSFDFARFQLCNHRTVTTDPAVMRAAVVHAHDGVGYTTHERRNRLDL